jgi:hypothetical protein
MMSEVHFRAHEGVRYVEHNGGAEHSAIFPTLKGKWKRTGGVRYKKVQDCAVVAVAVAFDIAYDHAFEVLDATDTGSVCDIDEKLTGLTINGWRAEPPMVWRARMTRIEFPKRFPSGRFLCKEHGGSHLTAYIDSIRYDHALPYDMWRMETTWKLMRVATA